VGTETFSQGSCAHVLCVPGYSAEACIQHRRMAKHALPTQKRGQLSLCAAGQYSTHCT
jgi:hypothetical protein